MTHPVLARIAERADLNAFVAVADEVGDGPLVAVKDNVDVAGFVTTVASRRPSTAMATVDAEVVANLRARGHSVVGKTNLGEWALDATGATDALGLARNPHDLTRTAGGSSSGSAIAVAAGLCDWAIATDTGGSVRIPASLCGAVGLKPTVGTLSVRGLFPSCPSTDTIGAIAPSPAAAMAAVDVMAGSDARPLLDRDAAGLRLAVPRGWVDGLDPTTERAWRVVTAGVPSVELPAPAEFRTAFLAFAPPEAAAVHADRLDGGEPFFSEQILRVLEAGRAVSAVEYLRARDCGARLREQVDAALAGYDALLVPTTACVAPPFAQAAGAREALTRFVRPFSLTGHPVVTVPAPSDGLPVGIQVVGRFGRDRDLAAAAQALHRLWS